MSKIITVDWDDCLFQDPAYESNGLWIPNGLEAEPVVRVHKFIKEKYQEGYEIHVVSFRKDIDRQEMVDLARLYELPIKSFTCTQGKNKTPFLQKLGSKLHIDDSVEVLVLAQQSGIKGLLVDWNQEDINCTAQLFEKI